MRVFEQQMIGAALRLSSPPDTEWGQDWDDWSAVRPSYEGEGNHLGFDPAVHSEGKGTLLEDGSVWTWPTHRMRPQHLEYDYRRKRVGDERQSALAFHIGDGGQIYAYGPERELTPDFQNLILEADPRLKPPTEDLEIPDIPRDRGHGYNIMQILEQADSRKADSSTP